MTTSLLRCFRHAAIAVLLLAGATSANALTYSLDDGTAEDAIGLTGGGDLIYLNQFTVTPGNNVINSVSVAFGSPGGASNSALIGTTVTALLYGDPGNDGNPLDATLLRTGTGVITSVDANAFQTFSFSSPATITGTSFFIGYIVTHPANTFPGAIDQSNPLLNRSFVAGGDAGTGNINNLVANQLDIDNVESYGLTGNWLIRANAVPEPSTWAAMGIGVAGLLILSVRRHAARA